MANNTSYSPFILDTLGAVETRRLDIECLAWVSKAASAGDDCVLSDSKGRVVWESVASGSNYVEREHFVSLSQVDGLTVTTLDSGTIYVYLRKRG